MQTRVGINTGNIRCRPFLSSICNQVYGTLRALWGDGGLDMTWYFASAWHSIGWEIWERSFWRLGGGIDLVSDPYLFLSLENLGNSWDYETRHSDPILGPGRAGLGLALGLGWAGAGHSCIAERRSSDSTKGVHH